MLTIEWDNRRLRGVRHAAPAGDGSVAVERAFACELPLGPDGESLASPATCAEVVAAAMAEAGVSEKTVRVGLPRDAAVVRTIDLPDVPEGEWPQLVRFQAAAKAGANPETLTVDFLPLPRTFAAAKTADEANPAGGDGSSHQVLAFTLPAGLKARIFATLAAAGLEVSTIGLAAEGFAEIVLARQEKAGGSHDRPELVVAVTDSRVEVALLAERSLLYTASTRLTGTGSVTDRVRRSISRALVTLGNTFPSLELAACWLIADHASAGDLASGLAEKLHLPVEPLDIAEVARFSADAKVADSAEYLGAAAFAIAARDGLAERLDFVAPREPVAPPNRKKLFGIAGGVAAAALFGGLLWWRGGQVDKFDSRREVANETKAGDEETLELLEPVLETAGALETWREKDILPTWGERQVLAAVADTSRAYLVSLELQRSSSKDEVGRILGKGRAKSRQDVERIQYDLRRNPGLKVAAKAPKLSDRDDDDRDYRWLFDLDVRVLEPGAVAEGEAETAPAAEAAEEGK